MNIPNIIIGTDNNCPCVKKLNNKKSFPQTASGVLYNSDMDLATP
jgi:hypothetical protein